MPIEFIQRLFRRKRKGLMSMSNYLKRHERQLKRNPGRLNRELEQSTQWSLREAQEKQGRSRAGGSKRKQPDQIKDRQIKGPTC